MQNLVETQKQQQGYEQGSNSSVASATGAADAVRSRNEDEEEEDEFFNCAEDLESVQQLSDGKASQSPSRPASSAAASATSPSATDAVGVKEVWRRPGKK